MENCEKAFQKHDYMLESHDEQLIALRGVPQTLESLNLTLASINLTIKGLNENAQTKTACSSTHTALETLRAEQLRQIRESQTDQGKRIGDIEKTADTTKIEIDEIRGVMKFLKWGIPVAVAISPAIASIVMHLQSAAKH